MILTPAARNSLLEPLCPPKVATIDSGCGAPPGPLIFLGFAPTSNYISLLHLPASSALGSRCPLSEHPLLCRCAPPCTPPAVGQEALYTIPA